MVECVMLSKIPFLRHPSYFGFYRHNTSLINMTPLTPELYCSNIKKSISFYTRVLGFNIQYQREEEGFVMLERQGSKIMLDEIKVENSAGQKRTWLAAPLKKPFGRGINMEIKTLNVDELYDNVQRVGADIFLPMEEKWYRKNDTEIGNRQFIVLDPDGYMLRFAEELGERQITPSIHLT